MILHKNHVCAYKGLLVYKLHGFLLLYAHMGGVFYTLDIAFLLRAVSSE